MQKLNILIADDHKIFNDGLASILKHLKIIENIYQAENGAQVLDWIVKEHIDVILMDINMPGMNGIETTLKVKSKKDSIKVIALTMHDSEMYVKMMMEAGCSGYLLKSVELTEIEKAILAVMSHKIYLSAEVNDMFYQDSLHQSDMYSYNEREIEILKYICQEFSTKEIAEKLFVSAKTIELYRTRLLQKTNSKNSAGLVVFALEKGFYHPDKK